MQIYKDIEDLYNRMSIGLADFNIDCLELFCNRLNINLNYERTSTFAKDNPNPMVGYKFFINGIFK